MRLCVLVASALSTDPGDALRGAVDGLRARGHDVTVGLVEARPAGAGGPGGVAVEDALRGTYDLAVAADWQGAIRLFEADARRFVVWADGFGHERLGSWQAERIAAALAYDLPTDFVAAEPWVARALRERRPDARVVEARRGCAVPAGQGEIEHGDQAQSHRGPRVLRAEALAPTAGERVVQYDAADVLIRLDPVDGVLGAPLEAARRGVVPIVAPSGGTDDLVEHGVSGLVVHAEDESGLRSWLSRLDGDRELLARLRRGARDAASAWPGPDEAAAELEAALEGLLAEEPPDASRWPVRLMADAMAGVAVYRNDHFVLSGELERVQQDPAVQAALKARDAWRTRIPEGARLALRRARGGS